MTLIAVGVAGVVLPLMPGVPFLIAGTALLGSDHPISRAVVERLRRVRPRRGKESS